MPKMRNLYLFPTSPLQSLAHPHTSLTYPYPPLLLPNAFLPQHTLPPSLPLKLTLLPSHPYPLPLLKPMPHVIKYFWSL